MVKKSEIIRVVAYENPPYVYPCFVNYATNAKTKCQQPGMEIVLLHHQLIRLGFQPQYIKADNYTHIKYMLETNMADISGSSALVQDAGNLSFTLPLIQSKLTFVVGQPESQLAPSLLFYQCDWLLWLTVAVSLLVCLLFKKFHRYNVNSVQYSNPMDFSGEFPLVAWGLSFIVFSSLYSNNLAVTLAHRRMDVPFNSLEELSEKLDLGECRFVLKKSDAEYYNTIERLKYNGVPTYYANKLFKAFDKTVIIDSDTNEGLIDKITQKECNVGMVYAADAAILQNINDKIYVIILEEMNAVVYVFYVNPSFKSRNERRLAFLNSGSISNLYMTYYEKFLEENRHKQSVDPTFVRHSMHKRESLKMSQLYDTFYVLFSGLFVAMMTFSFTVVKTKVKHLKFPKFSFSRT